MAEKMDLSLDDIIKQNRKKKWTQRRGFQQFRGRVGGKLVKGKNTANRGNFNRQQKSQQGRQFLSAAKRPGWKAAGKANSSNIRPKTTKSSTYKVAQRQQQSKKQRQLRQNLINQRRGQILSSTNKKKKTNKKYGGLVSDQIVNINAAQRKKLNRSFSRSSLVSDKLITQQKKQRRWKAKVQKEEPVLSVTVPNVTSNDVKVLFKKKSVRPRINRQTIRGSNSNIENPTILVTSPTSKDNQVEIITSQNVRRRKRWPKRRRDSLVNDEITNGVPGQELSKSQPKLNVAYEINRTDFAKASTGLTLDERFSRMVKYSEQTSVSATGERQVFL